MDFADYQLIKREVRYRRYISLEDKEDLIQDISVKLLQSKATHVSRAYIKKLIKNMMIDWKRNMGRQPDIAYDSVLADRAIEKGAGNGSHD